MKTNCISFLLLISLCMFATSKLTAQDKSVDWRNFSYPEINFVNKASGTKGWDIYNRIIPDPGEYIKKSILEVVKTLY